MPNYIVLRLKPPTAVDAVIFTTYLTNLTIKVYDISYARPTGGTLLGSAVFVPPAFPPPAGTQIVQHAPPPFFPLESVATALIPYPPPGPLTPEYIGPDLRIEFDRGAAQPSFDSRIYYNVQVPNLVPPFTLPAGFQLIPDSQVSVFVTLSPLNGQFTVPGDGTPPKFDDLLAAITAVLLQDPALAVNSALLSSLSVEQCRNIANEIVYTAQKPLPAPPESLADMYTTPPNTGTFGDSHEQNRQQFQGQLSGYYGPGDAAVVRLTSYIYSLSKAYWSEIQTQSASDALVTFPVNPNGNPQPSATVSEAQVIFTGALGLDVLAPYFYALTYDLSTQITPDSRYRMVLGSDQQANLDRLTRVLNSGWINLPATMNPAQAARIIEALNVPPASTVVKWNISNPSAKQIFKDWVAFPPVASWTSYKPGDDINGFWKPEAVAHAGAFLDLVLFALTQGYVIPPGPSTLANEIKLHLLAALLKDVSDLSKATPADWQKFFATLPVILGIPNQPEAVLPSFTLPGSIPARIAAFIYYVQKFFQMGTAVPLLNLVAVLNPLRFGVPSYDVIAQTITHYAGFFFGIVIIPATLEAAAAAALPGDAEAQAWAVQTITTLNELFNLSKIPGKSPAFRFSVMEALFARGFTSHEDVLDHPFDNFQQSLIGTIAYDNADIIYQNAGKPTVPNNPGGPPFGPINPGCLTDCIPPLYLSPLGPVAYLNEVLRVSERSTCENPFAAPDTGRKVLQTVIEGRRGPIEKLAVTHANLDTPLPLIDMVNECLESMARLANKHGSVYNTSQDALAGHKLCDDDCSSGSEHHDCGCEPHDCECHGEHHLEHEHHAVCHKPALIFDALPEHSTPIAAYNAIEPSAWDKLKGDFSACCLPYDQALDVSRTYLDHFHSCRFEEMLAFRKCITEFVLDPVNQPLDFQTHLWRYPVRIDIAIEYLGISREEYKTLFNGIMPLPCSGQEDTQPSRTHEPWRLFGFPDAGSKQNAWTQVVVRLPEFLKRTCLTYCEFIELWRSKFVVFSNGNTDRPDFPDCEPCCLDELSLRFPKTDPEAALSKLVIFIRLWRKLHHLCGAGYSFAQLADICDAFDLSSADFIRKLAAFQMLRDQFRLKLTGGEKLPPGATGADRTFLLSLWAPKSKHWQWAVHHLLEGIAYHAECRHKCPHRAPEFIKLLEANLDPLSLLAGFGSGADSWHAGPAHTLRFAEILAKIYASNFTIGEILYLFTSDQHLDGDDPFPMQEVNEADDQPLGLPDDEPKYSLWSLRRKLLHVHVPEEEAHEWNWRRIESSLTREFGFHAADVFTLGEHFFPHVLEEAGHPVSQHARRFTGSLAATTPKMWNSPPAHPFHYDATAELLWAVLPIADEEVLEQLTHLQALTPAEQQALQDVYFQPRKILSTFALLFENFEEAEHRLIEGNNAHERWRYFQRQFSKSHTRCRVVAHHLAEHVEAATQQEHPEGDATAHLILKDLFADENATTAAGWENDNGTVPQVTWRPPANGGAFAALLGLAGTGLEGEFTIDGGPVAWREIRDSMRPFGKERDRQNCPVPAVIPSMGLALTPQQMKYVTVRNGFAMDDAGGRWLGGAQGFEVKWTGVLFIDEEGEYRFRAGAPEEGDEEPSVQEAHHRSWRVTLNRGQKTWILLRHHWPDEENLEPATIPLRSGAYELRVEFIQHSPEYLHEDEVRSQHTGFEIKYCGPDTKHKLATVPQQHLFRASKNGALHVAGLAGSPADFLANRYTSSLRDIRRTYQRAFKALLFSHRFALSAKPRGAEGSELGYILGQKTNFAGSSCYRAGGIFKTHKADFDFNLLPIGDVFHSPAADDRTHPSAQRTQALFDWWERIFDYCSVRKEVRSHCDRHLWLLFEEAKSKQPADPSSLLRHMCADARHWPLDLRFFQGQNAPVYAVSSADLEDDRWMVRTWHADRWLRLLWRGFTVKDITEARPDLWAADSPNALVSGEIQTGNANLLQFLCDGCLENGEPPRYEDLRRLNDGLRERGRNALISYLCSLGMVQSAKELSEILLLDVLAGRCEKASRMEEAISAVQTFVRRARLGLEPGWIVTKSFAQMWDSRFSSYHVWQACKRRELYKENWIDWHELDKAGKIEAFGFLNEQLKRATLTIAEPGGVDYWPDHLPPSHPGLCLLQRREPAEMQILPAAREGLNLLATPERDSRPSWITTVPNLALQLGGTNPGKAAPVPPAPATPKRPFWMECAIRLGTRFIRVAAAAYPPASTEFEPRHKCHPQAAASENEDKSEEKKDECCVTCCPECGCEHPAHVDEYYFWLVDAERFDPESQPVYSNIFDGQQNQYYDQNAQVATPWHDPKQLHQLLEWPAEPMVRLAWCRVHNGEFQQPRRSDWGVPVKTGPGITPDLSFDGRVGDSLYFEVSNSVSGSAGFRYDMPPDLAEELMKVVVPPAPPAPLPPGGLVAYPFFAYFKPGARLFPWSLYSPAIAVAHSLRTHCRFEAAVKWYDLVYNPLDRDNRWALCKEASGSGTETSMLRDVHNMSCCCDTTKVSCQDARHRSILLHYLDTLLEWGDALMRRNSAEAFQQARLLFDTMRRILGRHPHAVKNPAKPHQTVASFDPLFAPINPRLMMLYDRLDDRLALIHECISPRRLAEPKERHDAQYWGNDPAREGWQSSMSMCCDDDIWCRPGCSAYRFLFLVQKARELAAQTREFGSALLAAFEKGDAEYLASVRARFERELTHLNRKARQDQWRDADWQVQALEKSKQSEQASRRYYAQLIANGLNAHETAYVDMTNVSMGDRAAANIVEGIAEAMDIIPDIFVGTVDFTQIPVGTKLAGLFKTIARITTTVADIANTTASLDLTEAGWDRRLQDWVHQVEILDIQIAQTELQILGAERRRHQALRELNVQQRQIEQATESLDLLRDKFTNHAVYLFLQKQTADLYSQMYELARQEAHQAERAFNFERGHTARKFIGCDHWDNLHEGLLAGERLQLDLARMEKEYLDLNCREYELTKHISLRLNFPMEFLRLKLTGSCEVEVPEWMFDLDYPGHFMRRIRNVTLTIPCVSGPFNAVHCRLTLLRSGTRVDPLLKPPAARCCHCCQSSNGYPVCSHDPRWVTEYGALEAIATSSGQNDAGLFEVNFRDDRYLPFEFHGAVSRWRIELPAENNYFDMDSLSDLILHLNYTAREGGERLRHAAREAAECDLPGAGWCLFDVRHEFADAWELFRSHREGEHHRRPLDLRFTRNMFPFVPGNRELFIDKMALLFDGPEPCGCECPGECPCCADGKRASHELELRQAERDERRFLCRSSEDWPGLYYGIVDDLCIGPLHGHRERAEIKLVFPETACDIESAYLLCRYSLKPKCCAPKRPPMEECVPCQ